MDRLTEWLADLYIDISSGRWQNNVLQSIQNKYMTIQLL